MRFVLTMIAVIIGTLLCNAQGDTDTLKLQPNKFEARIIPKSSVVVSGDKFEADILLVAYDTAKKVDVHINGWRDIPMVNGQAKYVTYAMGEGKQEVTGFITYVEGDKFKKLFFSTEYEVIPGNATFFANTMNVFYIGIENPITVLVPGVEPKNVVLSIANGSLKSLGGGNYGVTVSNVGDVKILIKTKQEKGADKLVGTMLFRAKPLPRLDLVLGTLQNGAEASADDIKSSVKLSVSHGESFAFDGLQYSIKSFRVTIYKAVGDKPIVTECKGEYLPQNVQEELAKLNKGDKVLIDHVIVENPAITQDPLPFVLTVK